MNRQAFRLSRGKFNKKEAEIDSVAFSLLDSKGQETLFEESQPKKSESEKLSDDEQNHTVLSLGSLFSCFQIRFYMLGELA